MNIPNTLTAIRIAFIPVLVVVYYWPTEWRYLIGSLVFSIAAITDWLDGYMARKLNQSTPLGAFLDPVADKLMVCIALALLIERFDNPFFTIPAVVIIGREIVISALREWMAELGKRTSVAVSQIGKIKTTFQMTAIIALLLCPQFSEGLVYWIYLLGMASLYLAAVLTLWSMVQYLRAAWPELMAKESNHS